MSTRSAIIRKTGNGYEGIYCHYDGYLEGVGTELLENYQDPGKVERLLALGDISSLGERVEPIGPHSFNKREEGTTTAYHRDRGESWQDVKPKRGKTVESVARRIGHNGYVYVFDGGWSVNGKLLELEIRRAKRATA